MKKIHRVRFTLPFALPLALIAALLLGACAGRRELPPAALFCPLCETCLKCPAPGATPTAPQTVPPLQPAAWSDLPGWDDDDLSAVWPGLLRSCAALRSRANGLAWRPLCDAAAALERPTKRSIRHLLERELRPWALTQPDGSGEGTITGYYEPILKGAREKSERFRHPLLAVPDDLLSIDFGDLYRELKTMRLRGRIDGKRVVPYAPRAEIRKRETRDAADNGGLRDKALAWVEDPIELFFLQIQGSGRIALPDGGQMRVGYAEQNGHPYQSIGRALVERGELKLEEASMQGIQAWARANPDKLDALLDHNPSYVFFRELPGAAEAGLTSGPPGAQGVPLTPERSLAVDPRTTPLGAPVYLATTQPNASEPLNRLMLAQDTGGAIKGVVRADFFWGLGPEAGQKAGRMRQKGRMWVLLPVAYPVDGPAAAR